MVWGGVRRGQGSLEATVPARLSLWLREGQGFTQGRPYRSEGSARTAPGSRLLQALM